MADIKTFHLPDLGEGLPDATIVEWLVPVGGTVKLDEPMVSMETAKAVVEVPSPFSGKLVKVHGDAGDVIATGAALAEFELDPNAPQRAEAESTGHHHAPPLKGPTPGKGVGNEAADGTGVVASDEGGEIATNEDSGRADEGTVVGAMQSSDRVHAEQAMSVGGVKAVPAVRALAKKLGVDLARVRPSGAAGVDESATSIGNETVTVVPRPTRLAMSSRPACASTTARTMNSPSPEPSTPRLRVPRKCRSARRGNSSGGMPGPSSATAMTTRSPRQVTCRRTRPPAGVNFTALPSRLATTRVICSPSMVSGGRMVGRRRARSVFPEPGGPMRRRL